MNFSKIEENEWGDSGGLAAHLFEKHVYELRFSLEARILKDLSPCFSPDDRPGFGVAW